MPNKTLNELTKDNDIKKLIELFKDTKVIYHSEVWQGKEFPLMLEIDNQGLFIYYKADNKLFRGWYKGEIYNNLPIDENIYLPFLNGAANAVKRFYAKISYLSDTFPKF